MAETILSTPFFTELVLPFLLVFTLIFAILEKTKVLGEEKRQVNAIVAFVVGLILIAFPYPRDIIVNLMPLLAVIAVVMLVFMMLYSFAGGKPGENWMKITFGILVGLALIIALLVLTGYWDTIAGAVSGGKGSGVATNLFFIIIIIAAIIIVLVPGKKSGSA
jgi:hypothetical protein